MSALNALDARISVVLDALVSEAQLLGIFERVNTHESKNAPVGGLNLDIWLQRLSPCPPRSGLSVTSARVIFSARMMTNFISEPQDAIDPALLSALGKYVAALHTQLTLGDPGSSVDVFGMAGVALDANAGYVPQDNVIFRAYLLTIPVLIDDVWDQVN